MQVQGIFVERKGAAAIVTMSNPGKKNAFTPPMRRELTDRLNELGNDLDVRAIILTGANGDFCAGADLTYTPNPPIPPKTIVQMRENTKDVHRLMYAIVTNPKPVIAAVEGDAFGAGFAMAVISDIAVGTAKSRFGASFTKIGLYPELGLLHILPRRIGLPKARRILMLSQVLSGPEAHEIELIDELAEPGGAVEKALACAAEFELVSPLSLTFIKTAFAKVNNIEEAIASELDYMPWLTTTEDSKEGRTALREKRKPVFKNR